MKFSEIINGIRIKGNTLGAFTWNADLIEFEGPLLSLFKDDKGNDFLFLWLDCNDTHNRWCIIPVDRNLLQQYLLVEISLLSLIKSAPFLVTFSATEKGTRNTFVRTSLEEFPRAYLPEQDSYLYDEISTDAAKLLISERQEEYSLGLDGELYIDDLSVIPKIYQQLYSFHYGLEYLGRSAVRNKLSELMSRWRGGFNAVNLFTGIRSLMPSIHRARVVELRYNSPGHIKLELLPRLANKIEEASKAIEDNVSFEDFESYYRKVYKYFEENKIQGFEKDAFNSTTALTATQRVDLSRFVDEFFVKMKWSSYKSQFDVIDANPLQQLRVLLAYYRRLKKLRELIVQDKLKIGESKIDLNNLI